MYIEKRRWCKKAGCNKFQTKNGYCDEHQFMYVEYEKKKDTRKQHTAHVQGAYDWQWTKCRNSYISKHPLCEDCLTRGKTTPAREVHHITPLEFGGNKYNYDNLVALCSMCHHIRHKKLFVDKQLNQQVKHNKETENVI